jgi:hypothetical protein
MLIAQTITTVDRLAPEIDAVQGVTKAVSKTIDATQHTVKSASNDIAHAASQASKALGDVVSSVAVNMTGVARLDCGVSVVFNIQFLSFSGTSPIVPASVHAVSSTAAQDDAVHAKIKRSSAPSNPGSRSHTVGGKRSGDRLANKPAPLYSLKSTPHARRSTSAKTLTRSATEPPGGAAHTLAAAATVKAEATESDRIA